MILENIGKAIRKSGKSYGQISKDTGIDRAVLCRIVAGSGTGSCSTKTADKLCKYLELELVAKKPKRKGEIDLCHGILRCQSVKHNCEIYHNRDKNAVQNMLKIVKSIFNTGKRPEVFCRGS